MKNLIIIICCLVSTALFSQKEIKKVDILIKNDSIKLPGTLTTTDNSSKLIIWIHGSGNIDRNGNQAGANVNANYIQQFREEINKDDIAFFSYDKRTANPDNRQLLKETLFDDFVSDAKKVIKHFKINYQFEEVVLIGHSQGSLIAMLASENTQKYISLAGPGFSIDETFVKQITTNSPFLTEATKSHFKELKETGTIKEINPMLVSLFAKQNHPFLVNWMQYKPAIEIAKLKIPTLIINGDADLQVKEEDANTLKEAKPDADLMIIKNMNHVLKTVTNMGDNQASYYSSKFPISEDLVKVVSEFVKK